LQEIIKTLKEQPQIKVVFTDLFDTLLHRTVHPNHVFKLWAKFVIRETGIELTIDELYAIRTDSLAYLAKDEDLKMFEIPYYNLLGEVYKRLVNCNVFLDISYEQFEKISINADYRAM